MPELPEVETVVRGLREVLLNRRLLAPRVWSPEVIESDVRAFKKRTAHRNVADVRRHGKWIRVELDSGDTVLAHLRMTGRFSTPDLDTPRGRHDHLQWPLDEDDRALRYSDVRRFGRFRLLPTSDVESYLEQRGFGPEPFDVSPAEFARRLGSGERPIKSALLDQRVVAGIGNIYADEILFAARIHPRTPVRRLSGKRRDLLHDCMQKLLRSAIVHRGTTFVNFAAVDGRAGEYATRLSVFRRTGLPCPTCGRAVSRLRLSGRSTHFCGRCQR